MESAAFTSTGVYPEVTGDASEEESVPVTIEDGVKTMHVSDDKITKVEIFAKMERFEALKKAMLEIGITGMTVTNVMGCGIQKGKPEYYRGAAQELSLLPRLCVEIVVSKVPVSLVIDTAKKVLYTGHIGDGKIFVYNVENVVKVRTGEEGTSALQDVEQY